MVENSGMRSIPIRKFAAGALVLLSLSSIPVQASVAHRKQIALERYHHALQMREALNGRPEDQRTPEDYEQVIDAFRRVYHLAPTSTRADSSVVAVADLLTEEARLTNDPKGFKDAIAQYEFLSREYPGSKYRFAALLSIGQIYRENLSDQAQAKATFEEFLKEYPRHPLAEDARAALKQMEEEAKQPPRKKSQAVQAKATRKPADESDDSPVRNVSDAAPPKHKGLPLVTSVRYWSTPDYTRIAIDLEDEVKYEAGRVPSPDRIFFDLHDSKLAPELIGKSYDIEDAFLKKVRVAQYKSNMARVVLEVDSLAEYSAFLLPNPYRLIIDVHGRKPAAAALQTAAAQNAAPESHSNSLTGVAQSPKSGTRAESKNTAVTSTASAKPAPAAVPTTAKNGDSAPADIQIEPLPTPTENNDLGLTEIAALSQDPQRVKATSKPTTGPVVDSVVKHDEPKPVATSAVKASAASSTVTTKEKSSAPPQTVAKLASVHEAAPTASGDISLIRALGLKIGKIVVDAGHGGHDTGTIGANGMLEKDLVLDVALRLGKLLEQKLGADVVYTRHDDTFIPLETRTAIANQNQADLFISIHANSSPDAAARGVETYYLNFTSSPEALEVAARENAVSETSVHELQDLVKKIALKEKIEESREFAVDVQKSLYSGESSKNPGIKDRGVKKAPFIVLIGANMPSILAEISFVSNPNDEKKLRTPEYRQRIAESLYRGIARYAQGLSGVKVASARASFAGQ